MLTAGTTVAGYRIVSLLGEGGMATVYEAHQVSLDRVVALKVLARRVGGDPAFRERFRRECHMQARLDHPNIVPVYEAGESEHGLWLTMRLVRGPTLRERLTSGKQSPGRVLELLAPIARALDAAHGHGLIHRDITPQNILIDEREHPYLADFGITKGRGDCSLTRTGHFVGTLDYVAPEQIRDETTSEATDVYSLAAILFECLTGRVPFDKGSEAAVLYAHLSEDPPRASEVEGSLSAAIDRVLRKGLAKQPSDRYDTASDLIEAVEEALGDAPQEQAAATPVAVGSDAAKPVPIATSGPRQRSRRRALLGSPATLIAAVGLVAALALGAGAMTGASPTAEPSRVSTGSLELDLPAGWRATGIRRSGIPGLELRQGKVLKPTSGSESVLVGLSAARGETLLPASLREAAAGAASGTPVSLGSELEALRYLGLRPRVSPEPLAVFVSPVQGGVATLVCRPYQPATEFAALCQRLASTLELIRGRPFPLGPSAALAAVLRRRLAELGRRRSDLRGKLEVAEGSSEQGEVASDLAVAFRTAARSFGGLEVTPQSSGALDRVVAGLRTTRDAYKELAGAARREDAVAFGAAGKKVAQAEAGVDDRLAALRPLGYRIGSAG